MPDLPIPISDEDKLLHNIIDGTPDISDLIPNSREEVYLKYIAMNGSIGGGGDGSGVNIVQTTGSSTTSVMSQNAVTKEFNKLGTSAYCNTGISSGNVPVINSDGKLDNSIIPSLSITDTFVAENENEMLNIKGAEKGDICIRTDENKTYILDQTPITRAREGSDTTLSDWVELITPTSDVESVNGKKGNVVLTSEDIDTYTKDEIDYKLSNLDSGTDINVVQTTGESTTDVMSQKAVSENTCLGYYASSDTGYGISIGYGADSSSHDPSFPVYATSIGLYATANHNHSIALGSNSQATEENTIAIGNQSKAQQLNSIAIGDMSDASYSNSIAIGESSQTLAEYSVAIGCASKARESYTVSFGDSEASYYANKTKRLVNVSDPINDQDVVTKNYLCGETLYSNDSGTDSTITLPEDYTNYSKIKVFYIASNLCFTSEFLTIKHGIALPLILKSTDNSSFYVYSTILRFTSTTVKFERNGYNTVSSTSETDNSATLEFSTDNTVKVLKIIGYKY